MFAQQGEGSSGWQGAGEVRCDGWPLSLEQTLHDMVRRGFRDVPAFFISTPTTITSESSSDLDTESAVSFFPEKSTTLGSLIGLQSSSRTDQSQATVVPGHGVMEPAERRKSTLTSSSSSRNRTAWCPIFGCGLGSNREALGMSPSLAHLLEEERKAAGSQRQVSNTNNEGDQFPEYNREGCGMPAVLAHTNNLFDAEGILAPRPSGAPLKLVLHLTSPSSPYLSADWNVSNGRHPHSHSQREGEGGGGEGPSQIAKLFTFWPNLYGRLLGSRLTT